MALTIGKIFGYTFGGILFLSLIAAIVFGGAVLSGWILTILWGWFAVETFHLPALTIAQALGISLIVRFLTLNPNIKDIMEGMEEDSEERTKKAATGVGVAIGFPLMALAVGWIVHLFI